MTRPAWQPREALTSAEVAFEERRRRTGLIAAPIVFLLLLLLPLSGLGREAHRLAAILGGVMVLWITEAIPLPVAGLLGCALAVFFGVDAPREVLSPFADHLVFLLIGGFILAEGIFVHGLNRRFAFGVLALPGVGARPSRVLLAYATTTALISAWISNTATTALMLPIGLSLIATLYPKGAARETPAGRHFASSLMLATAFAASLGGLATPIGTPTNLIGMGYLEEQLHHRVEFFTWMALAVPVVVLTTAAMLFQLRRGRPTEGADVERGRQFIQDELDSLGPLGGGERNVLIVFLVTVLLWTLPGLAAIVGGSAPGSLSDQLSRRLPEGMVALFGASLLFFLPTSLSERRPTLTWSDASRIDWGTVLLLGSGMALGRLCDKTGLARAFGELLAAHLPNGASLLMLAASTLAAVLISETTSNMAAVTMLVPLVISISQGAHVDPTLPAIGATMGGSLGFMLPVSTAPNAMVYGSGHVPITRMIRQGLLLDLAGTFIVIVVLSVLGPFVLHQH